MSGEKSREASDIVTLGKTTDFKAITWQFPNTNQCPLKQCMLWCSNRSEALNHFCIHHADLTMLCLVCEELFFAKNPQNLLRHHQYMHPNEAEPKLKTQTSRSIELVKDTSQSNIYCWNCRKNGTNCRCSKCPRHFHEACVTNRSGADWICMECTKKNDFSPFDISFIPKMLHFIKTERKFASLLKLKFTHEQIQNAIDFSEMQQKTYETGKQFVDDVKWFLHHCRSVHRQKLELQMACEELIQNMNVGVQTIDACATCYQNMYEKYKQGSVKKQCTMLHLLVWAKSKVYDCYWPAKALAVNATDKTVCIQYFGDFSCYLLPTTDNNCYLYSDECPEKKGGGRPKILSKALLDVAEYIVSIRAKFGNFKYAKSHIVFQPEEMEDCMKGMIANTDSNYYANDNEKKGQNAARKRTTKAKSIDCRSPAKKTRVATDSKKAIDPIEKALRIATRVNCDKNEQIKKLKTDLDGAKNELDNAKKDLEQKNAQFADEKKGFVEQKKFLMDKIASLEMELNSEREKFVDATTTFTTTISALEKANVQEKKALEAEKKDLMKKNAELEAELAKEREKSDARKKALEQALEILTPITHH